MFIPKGFPKKCYVCLKTVKKKCEENCATFKFKELLEKEKDFEKRHPKKNIKLKICP